MRADEILEIMKELKVNCESSIVALVGADKLEAAKQTHYMKLGVKMAEDELKKYFAQEDL